MIFMIRLLFVENPENPIEDSHISQCNGKITADLG